MNQIVSLNTASTLTMSSREIAKLTGKSHQHVRRDVFAMCEDLGTDVSSFGRIYLDSRNRQQSEFALPKRETLILVSGYSVELRARLLSTAERAKSVLGRLTGLAATSTSQWRWSCASRAMTWPRWPRPTATTRRRSRTRSEPGLQPPHQAPDN